MDHKDTFYIDAKDSPMRDIVHKTKSKLNGRCKVVSLLENAHEKECVTNVRKNFIYMATEAMSEEPQPAPQVRINKSFDSQRRDEKFSFKVKGFFYVNHSRRLMKVAYCHTLRINLHWKSKTSTPKKTVTMA